MITSIKFINYKAFKDYTVNLSDKNIFVGRNNQGKSTIIEAFRVLNGAMRKANSNKPKVEQVNGQEELCYRISEDLLPSITIKNAFSNYIGDECSIIYNIGKRKKLKVVFSQEGFCYLIVESDEGCLNPTQFKRQFPLNIVAVPILSRFEETEKLLDKSTVQQGQYTHKASRHFRNYWYYNRDSFKSFSSLLSETWDGISIETPELDGDELIMFCEEERVPREIFWAGSGFQIWCQILTYITKVKDSDILILDEPEVFLHPSLQRDLIKILQKKNISLILATHSTEILAEAAPKDIVMVDKKKKRSQRISDIEGLQDAFLDIGSVQNLTLTKLAENKRVLFLEGITDGKILSRFSKKLDQGHLFEGDSITIISSDGFGNWTKLKSLNWGLEKTLGQNIKMAAVFDRDYRCKEELESIEEQLRKSLKHSFIFRKKEIENYMLNIDVLNRVLRKELTKRSRDESSFSSVESLLLSITDTYREAVTAQMTAKKAAYLQSQGSSLDPATVIASSIEEINRLWTGLSFRLEVLPGKQVLKDLRSRIRDKFNINLTDAKILEEYKIHEIDTDIKNVIMMIASFVNN